MEAVGESQRRDHLAAFGRRLRKWRESEVKTPPSGGRFHGAWSQYRLGVEIGKIRNVEAVKDGTVSSWERGLHYPSTQNFNALGELGFPLNPKDASFLS